MKILALSAVATCFWFNLMAQTPESTPAKPSPAANNLPSTIFDWEKLKPIPTTNGVRRDLFDSQTATLDKLHCHITTLNPGQTSGEPRRHLQEEVIIVKEGSVEATVDGRAQTVGPGSVIFFAANAVTRLRNAGAGPATYTVVYFYTPRTPRS